MRTPWWICILFACFARAEAALAQQAARSDALIIFAAASLTDTLQKISDAYTARSGVSVKLSFAASSTLARQIEAGARADVYFAADQEWMDYLEARDLIEASTRTDLVGNRLALIAPRDSTVAAPLTSPSAMVRALGANGRLATGDPDSVPAGRYAKAALSSLGLWEHVERRLARAENVRVALSYVARGEAPLGIVYATDAAIEPRVRIVELFSEASHPPISYPVAVVARAHPQARDYLAFLHGAEPRKVFLEAGFLPGRD